MKLWEKFSTDGKFELGLGVPLMERFQCVNKNDSGESFRRRKICYVGIRFSIDGNVFKRVQFASTNNSHTYIYIYIYIY